MTAKNTIMLAVSAALLAGCQQRSGSLPSTPMAVSTTASSNDAIQTAIQSHLGHNGNLRLDAFDMTVKQVTFDGDHAQAQVEFHAKTGAGTMQLTYALVKQGGAWTVLESKPAGSNFSHPPLDKTQGSANAGKAGENPPVFDVLDKIHGGSPTATQNLPPGHPPITSSPKDKQP
jgi:hypothetical protein